MEDNKKEFNSIMIALKEADESKNKTYSAMFDFIKGNNLTLEDFALILIKYRESLLLAEESGIAITNVEYNEKENSITYFMDIPEESDYKLTGRDLILAFKESIASNPIYKDSEIHIAYMIKDKYKWTYEDYTKARCELLSKLYKNPLYPFGEEDFEYYYGGE